jgi:hypothetical protein
MQPNATETQPKLEVPVWVTKTPDETGYTLTLWSEDGSGDDIHVSRAEYITLKAALAKMRGFDVAEAEAETAPAEAAGAESLDLSTLDGDETEYLGTCLEIHRNDYGTVTPIEQLITGLVMAYRVRKGALTPEDVDREVEEFKDCFPDAISKARFLLGRYPALVSADSGEALATA